MMECKLCRISVPKSGNASRENDDAFALLPGIYSRLPKVIEGSRFAVSIADGATMSSYSGLWAKMLTSWYVERFPDDIDALNSGVRTLSKYWESKVLARPLSWFAEIKAKMGTSSTLLVFEITEQSTGQKSCGDWRAVAIGDSCLFHFGQGCLRQAFPVMQSNDFGNSPDFLSSLRESENPQSIAFQRASGNCQSTDYFFLATDALAEWILRKHELDENPWDLLIKSVEGKSPAKSFSNLLQELRDTNQIKNDDTTLVSIRLF